MNAQVDGTIWGLFREEKDGHECILIGMICVGKTRALYWAERDDQRRGSSASDSLTMINIYICLKLGYLTGLWAVSSLSSCTTR